MSLPTTAKLSLHRIEGKMYPPLAFVPVVNLTHGRGLIFQTTLAVSSGSMNFLEGCYHMMVPYNQPFPGIVISTGTEDYFDSAYYFNGGQYRFPVSGSTHLNQSDGTVKWSGYRFHEQDPLTFTGGVRFLWRVGDLANPIAHPDSPKCYVEEKK